MKKAYAFRTDDMRTITYLDSLKKQNLNQSEFISKIVEDYCNGKLLTVAEAKKTQELAELKIRQLRAKIIKDEFEAKLGLLRGLHYSPDDVSKIFRNEKSVFDVEIKDQVIQDDGRLRCMTCGILFEMRAYGFQQVDDYVKHVKFSHSRELTDNERQQLEPLYGSELV